MGRPCGEGNVWLLSSEVANLIRVQLMCACCPIDWTTCLFLLREQALRGARGRCLHYGAAPPHYCEIARQAYYLPRARHVVANRVGASSRSHRLRVR